MKVNVKYSSFTPREIVSQLNRFIIGQSAAKRAVAIALRNRWRRKKVDSLLRDEILPKNIILMGPTGCGKTEIARRSARLADAPFVKVEASKFTEVGYVGRDVDSMVRDLVEMSVKMCKDLALTSVKIKAEMRAEELILDILLPDKNKSSSSTNFNVKNGVSLEDKELKLSDSRKKMRAMLRKGQFNDKEISININTSQSPAIFHLFSQTGIDDMASNLQDVLLNTFGSGKKKQRKMKVFEALKFLSSDEAQKLIDIDQVYRDAIIRAEQSGIIFIDEIDKVAGRGNARVGPDVSREGVQRDILPIIEGSSITTKYGLVKTDHILFIAAGAFHSVKPSDLIPELQGRFPIRVELDSLTENDFVQILTEPENSLVKQYTALLKTEQLKLHFTKDGIIKLAKVAAKVNSTQENIGARRLYAIMEKLLEEESFFAPDRCGTKVVITEDFVSKRLMPILKNEDLSNCIL